MKNTLLYILIAAFSLLVFSCKKDQQQNIAPVTKNIKKYPVTFNMSGFTQTKTGFSLKQGKRVLAASKILATSKVLAATDTVSGDNLYNYVYVVYDDKGNEVSRIKKQMPYGDYEFKASYGANPGENYFYTGDLFSTIKDSLTAGNYTVVVASGGYDLNIDTLDNGIHFNANPLSTAYLFTNGLSGNFFKKFNITVGSKPISQDIVLDRISSGLQLIIQDPLPQNAYTLYVTLDKEATAFDFNTVNPSRFRKLLGGWGIAPNESYVLDVLNTTTPTNITIQAADINDKIIATKVVQNVHFYRNKRTTLSGKLFTTGPAATQFTITANQAWDPDAPTVHF